MIPAHLRAYLLSLLQCRSRQVSSKLERERPDDSDWIGFRHELDTINEVAEYLSLDLAQ